MSLSTTPSPDLLATLQQTLVRLKPFQTLAVLAMVHHPPPVPLITGPLIIAYTTMVIKIGDALTDGLAWRISQLLKPTRVRPKHKRS